jgi:sarcosine oxidase subunit beta
VEKAIVCACEDVSVHDIEETLARGFTDIESVKRYTGLGTGPCQGKSCVAGACRVLAARRPAVSPGDELAPLLPFRARAPHTPSTLAGYAGLPLESLPAGQSVLQTPATPLKTTGHIARAPGASREPLPEHAEVVIIGGGIMGLALAWHLAGQGIKPLVLERSYLCAGASGRNGGGVRAQWTTPTLIELAKESIDFMGHFAQELGINIWLRRGGYLFLAHDEETGKRLEASTDLQRKHGLPTRMIGPEEACEIAPGLDAKRFISAAWNPDDGVVFPWPFMWGYADGAAKRGARIETFTQVTGIELSQAQGGPRVHAVKTDRGTVRADRVVIASGAWSPQIAKLAGVALPNQPYRHEIVSSEPLKPFLGPLVSMLGTGLYFSQSMRGEIVGGMGDPDERAGLNQESSLRFLTRYSRALTELMPRTGNVKLLRQWAGCYDVTPDHSPIIGETPGVGGLLQMSGFVGHGFMMAPAVARRMADWMGGAQDEMFERYALRRFAEGRQEKETFIIG